MRLAPLTLNHVGITVPDIFATIDWYERVFACTHIMDPRLMSIDQSGTAETREVFGAGFRCLLQAHLLTGNGVGIELFEPLDPKPLPVSPTGVLDYRRGGPWHIALTYPDVDAMLARILAHGGQQHSAAHDFAPGRPWRLAYARDPWGTTIEIVSHSYAEMFGNWPQPGATSSPILISRDEAIRLRAAV